MTVTITKLKLAIGVLAVALLVPATAMAVHSFDDVPDTAFYHDAVAWALAEGITVGCNGGTGFCGQDTVTRGENITFAHRYDTNVVQPKFATIDANTAALGFSTMYWAWVTSTGAIYTDTSSTGVTATRTATGEYVVTFPVDVNACSWSIAHRSVDGIFLILDPDFDDEPLFDISTRTTGFLPATYHNEDIRDHVTDEAGVDKNTNFQLQVLC